MTPSKPVFDAFGKPMPRAGLTQQDIEALPKLKNGQPDVEKAPTETIGNIILLLLTNYSVQEKQEVFYVGALGQLIVAAKDEENIELTDKLKKFLLKLIEWGTIRQEKDKEGNTQKAGMFFAFALAQVLADLGEVEE